MKLSLLLSIFYASAALAADPDPAARAINQFGVELHQRFAARAPKDNLCLSPYSIQSALAMTYAGTEGVTATEMARVLHFADGEKTHEAFAALAAALAAAAEKSVAAVKDFKNDDGYLGGGPSEPITLAVANRLYGQNSYEFRQPFLDLLKETYRAPLEEVDFAGKPKQIRNDINAWVETQTRNRIRDFLPPTAITADPRLVLVNAIYLKASWAHQFKEFATEPAAFHAADGTVRKVPTMQHQANYGYAKADGYRAIALPYVGDDLQFLILLPDEMQGLAALEKTLTAETLTKHAKLPPQKIALSLPKFRFEPPTVALGAELQAMGMKSAFDRPVGSANFSRMAPRRPEDYLKIGEVFHKTFIALDERGTEAAAATAVVAIPGGIPRKTMEVKVDHPFLFAIQHRGSGACLFLGRVAKP